MQIVTKIELFPYSYKDNPASLDSETIYLFEYRRLIQFNPEIELPPIICVVESGVHVDPVFFKNRIAAVVTGNSLAEVMLAMMEVTYICGQHSPQFLEDSQVLLDCHSFQALLDVGLTVMCNPILVTGPNQQIIGFSSPDKVSAPVYREITELGYLPVRQPSSEYILSDENESEALFYALRFDDLPAILYKTLQSNGRVLGYLHVLKFNQTFQNQDPYSLELLGKLVTVELLRRPSHNSKYKSMQIEEFFGKSRIIKKAIQKLF